MHMHSKTEYHHLNEMFSTHLYELNINYLIHISELRTFHLDDGILRMHTHAQCLRNKQCACAYDLNKTR